MVRNTLKLTKFGGFAVAALTLLAPAAIINNTNALPCTTDINTGVTTCEETRNFQVDVQEILEVVLTPESVTASGADWLESKVDLTVTSNNAGGFLATLTSADESTDLVNKSVSTSKIPSLTSSLDRSILSTKGVEGKAAWGVATGTTTPTVYNPIVAKNGTPYRLLSTHSTTGSEPDKVSIYFGAKADGSTVAGTYERGVLISVVSGVRTDQPSSSNPGYTDQPSATPPTQDGPSSSDKVAVTPRPSTGTTTDSDTTIKDTSNSSRYDGFAYPQGEMNTTATINEGTPLATGLAITAAIAAIFGIFFFILLFKRRKDEDEEEQY